MSEDDEKLYIQGTTPEDPQQELEGARTWAICTLLMSLTLAVSLLMELFYAGRH